MARRRHPSSSSAASTSIRGLAMDAVQKANSGHPGTPMALAPLAHVLWTRIMRYDADRPRLARPRPLRPVVRPHVDAPLLDALPHRLRARRSTTSSSSGSGARAPPGHPEYRHTAGVEVTTGPLGQGIAQRGRHGDRRGATCASASVPTVSDHHVFAFCSDGDLEEGVSHEAASLAGHLGLGRLVVRLRRQPHHDRRPDRARVHRRRRRSASRRTAGTSSSSARSRTTSTRSSRACATAMAETDAPEPRRAAQPHRLAVARSTPTPRSAHGNPLGDDEVRAVKEILGLPAEDFYVPDDVLAYYRDAGARGARHARGVGAARARRAHGADTERAAAYDACLGQRGLAGWEAKLPDLGRRRGRSRPAPALSQGARRDRRRRARARDRGGADLTGNTGIELKGAAIDRHRTTSAAARCTAASASTAWARSMNGMAASAARCPSAARSSCSATTCARRCGSPRSSGYKVAFVWSHDSVGVGEDGPTHQPVEHLAAMRAMPGLRVIRPADANEVAQAWRVHIDGDGPTAIILTRQKRARCSRAPPDARAEGVPTGAYMLVDERRSTLDLVLIGTGSEVQLCVAAPRPARAGRHRCASCRCRRGSCSRRSPTTYRDAVLPPGRAHARGRGGRQLRLGPLRRRRRGHRPLRRVGARRRRCSTRARHHARERRRARARALLDRGGSRRMTSRAIARLQRLRAEPLVRQPHPALLARRRARTR